MASVECPGCGYEVPLDDLTFRPVLENHAPWCSWQVGRESRSAWEVMMRRVRLHYGMDDDPGAEKKRDQ